MASSKGGRSYSDPSYGSVKVLSPYDSVTTGTRATALVDSFKVLNSVQVLDWTITHSALATGGTSQWVLAATSANGTSALGTIVLAGTHAIGAVDDGTISGAGSAIAAGGTLDLYSVLSTSGALVVKPHITYRETYDSGDN